VSFCSKPGCARAGTAVLGYDYAERLAVLEDPGEPSPHVYLLCSDCAAKLKPPMGWTLRDRRSSPPLFVERDPIARVDVDDVEEPAAVNAGAPRLSFGRSA
jgi:hypothetical protein